MAAKPKMTKREAKQFAQTLFIQHGTTACYVLGDNYPDDVYDLVWPYLDAALRRCEKALGFEVGSFYWG